MTLMLDLVVLSIFIFSAFMGARQGFAKVAFKLFGKLGAYILAAVVVRNYASEISWKYDYSIILTSLVLGCGVFLVTMMIFSLCESLFFKKKDDQEEDEASVQLSSASKIGGAILSFTMYFLLLTLAFWIYDLARISSWGQQMPDVSSSIPAQGFRKVVQNAVYIANYDGENKERAETMARLAASPGATLDELKQILVEDKMEALISDDDILADLSSGDMDRLAENESLDAIFTDERLMQRFRDLGLLKKDETKEAILKKLSEMSAKVHELANAPEIQEDIASLRESVEAEGLTKEQLSKDSRFVRIVDKLLKRLVKGDGK